MDEDFDVNELLADYQKRIVAAKTREEQEQLTREAAKVMDENGHSIPISDVDQMIGFAVSVTQNVIQSAILAAQRMNMWALPIDYLEALSTQIPDHVRNITLKSLSESGIPIGFDDGVPDDLSGLDDGLEPA